MSDRKQLHVRLCAFTLVEMTAVMLVLSILVLLVLPDLSSSNRAYRLQSAASEVMAALHYAQSKAINTGTSYGCATVVADNTIRCFQVTGSAPYATINHPLKKTPYLIDFDSYTGHGGISISANTFTSETVTFDSFGSPSGGGTITVSLSGYSKVVSVAAISGLISRGDP